jgi:hypothetical protein
MRKFKINKVIGIITIGINLFLLLKSFHLLYCYNFTNSLFLFRYPSWILWINAVLGSIGIYISILLYKNRIKIKAFFSLVLSIWLLALIIF